MTPRSRQLTVDLAQRIDVEASANNDGHNKSF